MSILIRTIIMFFPVVLFCLLEGLRLAWCAIRSGFLHVCRMENYWPLSHEWFHVKASAEVWYKFWLYGFEDY